MSRARRRRTSHLVLAVPGSGAKAPALAARPGLLMDRTHIHAIIRVFNFKTRFAHAHHGTKGANWYRNKWFLQIRRQPHGSEKKENMFVADIIT